MSGKAKRRGLKQKNSLTDQILGTEQDRVAASKRKSKNKKNYDSEEVTFISEKTSKKILQEAKLQQDELEEEYGIRVTRGYDGSLAIDKTNSDDGDSEQEYEEDDHDGYCPMVNEEDEKAMMVFMSKNQPERRTLADIILEKLKEKETEIATIVGGSCEPSLAKMDDRVATIFKGVGVILSKYRSGKLPKAFKAIPSLSNWEEALYLTEPDKWTAAAMWQATRVFASNLNSLKAQRFFSLVLLPRVRDDITEYKRLNYHLYSALKKALYKPAAFFKGILLPLCESGTCTLREALIISSVIAKTSIPVLHSSAALLKIAEMDYTGGNSIFLRTLFEKKYALPYRVIDASVCHYLRFADDPRRLPVLWHQSLLSFVQRYKEDLSFQQKKELLELIHVKSHSEITPEIRREIVHSKCRDGREPMEE